MHLWYAFKSSFFHSVQRFNLPVAIIWIYLIILVRFELYLLNLENRNVVPVTDKDFVSVCDTNKI